jgi:hypothetical protein
MDVIEPGAANKGICRMRARLPLVLAISLILFVCGFLWSRAPLRSLAEYDQPFYVGIAYDLRNWGRFTDGFLFAGSDAEKPRPPGMRFAPLYPALVAVTAARDGSCVDGARGSRVFWLQLAVGCKSCVRPVCAVLMTAGPDVIRRSGPNHSPALDSA